MNINDGLDNELEIKREVSRVLTGFDLIVVVERFFESMILLGMVSLSFLVSGEVECPPFPLLHTVL